MVIKTPVVIQMLEYAQVDTLRAYIMSSERKWWKDEHYLHG